MFGWVAMSITNTKRFRQLRSRRKALTALRGRGRARSGARPALGFACATFFAASLAIAAVPGVSSGGQAELEQGIAAERANQSSLVARMDAQARRIEALQKPISKLTFKINKLRGQIAKRKARVKALRKESKSLERDLERLAEELNQAELALEDRIVEAYKRGNEDLAAVIIDASSVDDMFSRAEMVRQMNRMDREIIENVIDLRVDIAERRKKVRSIRADIDKELRGLKKDEAEVERSLAVLLRKQAALKAELARQASALQSSAARQALMQANLDAMIAASAQVQGVLASSAVRNEFTAAVASGHHPNDGHDHSNDVIGQVNSALGGGWPVSGEFFSGYGPRGGRNHDGIDIGAAAGTPIGATGAGKVVYSGWMDGYGNTVIIDHGGGKSTLYAHMSEVQAAEGTTIESGAEIGKVGCTGRCSGDHVHYEVRENGEAVDPESVHGEHDGHDHDH